MNNCRTWLARKSCRLSASLTVIMQPHARHVPIRIMQAAALVALDESSHDMGAKGAKHYHTTL